jgi:hypothetical protein
MVAEPHKISKMKNLEEKIRKVMYSLTVHYRGNVNFWISKGFNRLNNRNKDSLYNYWKGKATSDNQELLNKIEELWQKHQTLDLQNLKKTTTQETNSSTSSAPSLFEMFKNVTKSTAQFIKSGMVVVSPEDLEKRLAICRNCEKFDAEALNGTGRCKLCGCSTALKLKMATEKCPIGKWLPTV